MGSVPFRGDIKGYSDSSAFKREVAGQNKKAPFPDRLPGRRKRKLIFRGTIPVGVFEKRPLVGIGIKANAFPCNGRNPSTPTGEALFGRLLRGQKSCVCCCPRTVRQFSENRWTRRNPRHCVYLYIPIIPAFAVLSREFLAIFREKGRRRAFWPLCTPEGALYPRKGERSVRIKYPWGCSQRGQTWGAESPSWI